MKRILITLFALAIALNQVTTVKAQNTGPVAPEASSFEPVDATDMVNLVTGDFSYVIPLLEVPSPEGGFPLALSYHGGIAMDQEASWVGLGWNITPGAINRNVLGFPDDSKGDKVLGLFNSDPMIYTSYTRSLNIPLQIWGLPSIGLTYSFGTHRSLGGSVGYSFGNSGWNVSASVNTDGDYSFG
jgi:hypothetical protein